MTEPKTPEAVVEQTPMIEPAAEATPPTEARAAFELPVPVVVREEEPEKRPGRKLLTLYVLLATTLEIGAAVYVVTEDRWGAVFLASIAHLLATTFCWLAARRRRPDMSSVERDVVVGTALFVPVCGPAYAWRMPRPPEKEEERNAHAVFEDYADHVRPVDADYERTLFTGNYERDLARELDAESYHAVLRNGSTDQKRSALQRLAELGEPKHFQLVRQCLLDPSHEVRLYAYNELERASRHYEESIAADAAAVQKAPHDADAYLSMARTYFAYAASGIHDTSMAAFYFQSAVDFAGKAREAGHGEPDPVWVHAHALGRLGQYKEALQAMEMLSPAQRELPTSCLVRAELAYRQRDFFAVRQEAARLQGSDAEIPNWLKAMEAQE